MFEAKFQVFVDRTDKAASKARLAALRREMVAQALDGFLVPRADEHQGEYVPACDERLAWLTGFTGSAGFAIVFAKSAFIFSDGRYTLQVKAQVDAKLFEYVPSHEVPVGQWLGDHAPEGARIGYDPRLHTAGDIDRLTATLARRKAQLVAVETNPIDAVWQDRPAPPSGKIVLQPAAFSGETVDEKVHRVQASLAAEGADALIVSDPHNVAWLLNIRGSDVSHTPIALCYALVLARGSTTLFIEAAKVPDAVRHELPAQVEIAEPDELAVAVRQISSGGRTVRLDAGTAGAFLRTMVERSGGKADIGVDPITLMKARKNGTEITGARAAHLRDGAAMARFLCWLDGAAVSEALTEIDAAAALEGFRIETGKLKDIAFPTIAGMGPNGAMPHYRVSETSNRALGPGFFLVDSGAQYQDGTTDITRVIAIGKPSAEMKDRYTRVLKGMIAVSRARFPKGTSGAQLDTLARQFLWEKGLDFGHGTGHGVGSYLSVHEGPQRIAKTGHAALEPGMIVSNEPGFYKPGRYGIRIENLIIVQSAADGAYEFETLTLVPIDTRAIAKPLLNKVERAWLNAYHARVLREVGPLVDAPVRAWLAQACAPI
ncbi:MAG: aminopeptidase P family protein [Beijerinckiaceae bacterium]|nr:aminopeptidase P family protein [Beijerinckiaceae bacterium]